MLSSALQFKRSISISQSPPLQLYGLDGRYAHALYSAAHKENKLESVEKELKKFSTTMKSDLKLHSIFLILWWPGNLKRIFSMIVENGRYNKIQSILKAFENLMASHRGEIDAEIITAQPLEKDQMKEIESALHGFVQKGQFLKISTRVDPSIIGGMIVKIGDKYADMSMSSKLLTYRQSIEQAV